MEHPHREVEWWLPELVEELNQLVRLKVPVLRPRDLESAACLLSLPRYAEVGDLDERLRRLHSDLASVVKRGLPEEDQLSAGLILRPIKLSPKQFRSGEKLELLGDREKALGRLLSWEIRKIRRDREPLLYRVAFALFQLGLATSPDFIRGYVIDAFRSSVMLLNKKKRVYWHSFTITRLRDELNIIKNWQHFGYDIKVSQPTLVAPDTYPGSLVSLREAPGALEYGLVVESKIGEAVEVTIQWEATTSKLVPFLDGRPDFPVTSLELQVSASPALVSFYRIVELTSTDQETSDTASPLLLRNDNSPITHVFPQPRPRAGYRIHWIPQ